MTPTPGTRPVSSVVLATNWRLSTVGNQTHPDSSFYRQKFMYGRLSICFSSCIFHSCFFHHCYLLLFFPLLQFPPLLSSPVVSTPAFPLPHFQRPQRCSIAHFEKVPTGDARWRAQWPAFRVRELACALAGGTTAARANRARAWGRGP